MYDTIKSSRYYKKKIENHRLEMDVTNNKNNCGKRKLSAATTTECHLLCNNGDWNNVGILSLSHKRHEVNSIHRWFSKLYFILKE